MSNNNFRPGFFRRRIRAREGREHPPFALRARAVVAERPGHSDIGTASNIYTHLDYSAKIAAANKILGYFPQ